MFMELVTGQQMCTTVYCARFFLDKYCEELEVIDKKKFSDFYQVPDSKTAKRWRIANEK